MSLNAPRPQDAPAIYDIGFQHYDGARLRSRYVVRTLYVDTLRGCFGLGRSLRAKVMPFLLLAFAIAPAVIVAAVAVVGGDDTLEADAAHYVSGISLLLVLFVAGQAPQAVSRDIRHRTISLYLARPLSRNQYVLAKAGALITAAFIFLAVPSIVLHVGGLLAKLSVRDQLYGIAAGLLTSAAYALLFGGIALAICAWTVRRGFGIAAVVGAFLLLAIAPGIIAEVAWDTGRTTFASLVLVASPFGVVEGMRDWVFDVSTPQMFSPTEAWVFWIYALAYVLWLVVCALVLRRRYRTLSVS